jgi:hypothetical protein
MTFPSPLVYFERTKRRFATNSDGIAHAKPVYGRFKGGNQSLKLADTTWFPAKEHSLEMKEHWFVANRHSFAVEGPKSVLPQLFGDQ